MEVSLSDQLKVEETIILPMMALFPYPKLDKKGFDAFAFNTHVQSKPNLKRYHIGK